ncbi:MAG: ubiquinol-cytochrome c reductase iron-sulfur subunit [Pseudomonadota bacterium]
MAATDEDVGRRDFIILSGTAFAGIGALSLVWPFVHQMNPDAGALALASTEVDIGPVEEGQAITVMWRGKPVFIRHRTADEIKEAQTVNLADLPDPADDAERTKEGQEKWLVAVGICTHLGCIPKGQAIGDSKGEYNGWFCPCHGSHYDSSGRIRKGPAPSNLEVPPFQFVDDTTIKIG